MKKIVSVGLDLSLTGTGVVIVHNNKIVESQLVKSKPSGDRPIDELNRIQGIVLKIISIIDEYEPSIAVIENLAFMARNTTSLTQLAGLSYLTRSVLNRMGIPFIMCAPTTLKKFATGKGNCEKDHMILEAYKKYGVESIDNNIADAIFLAKIGEAMVSKVELNSYQKETIELLSKQL